MFNRRGIIFGFSPVCFTLAVFLALRVSCLSAQERQEQELSPPDAPKSAPSGIITSIEVTGMKRTRRHIAEYPLEQFLGQDAETFDINEVMAAVKDTGVLEPLQVELAETKDGITLRVAVEEKWSFFPVPLVIGGSGGTSVGLFLAETNAFGLRDQAAVGGLYGASGILAMVLYNHTPDRKGKFGWSTVFSYDHGEREDASREEKIYRRYTAGKLQFSFRLNYPFTDHITGSTALSFSDNFLEENAGAFNQPEGGAVLLSFSPGFSLRYSNWDGYLLSQRSLSLGYTYNLAVTGSSFHHGEFRGIYEQSLIPGFRINLRSGAVLISSVSGSLNPLFEEGPQRALVNILPQNTSARQYAGFSAGLEKYLIKINWGTLSVLASWQCVFSQSPLSESKTEFSHGPSGGITFYLRRLAIPALTTNLAYNVSTGIYQFSFSIGTGI